MPKVTKLNSSRQVSLILSEYLIDWDHAVSKPQKAVKDFLRPYWEGRVITEELRIPGSLLRVDLMDWSRHIAVEVSPKGSHSFNPFFHKNRVKFGAAMGRELGKAEWLEQNGFKLVEIFDEDIPNLSREWFAEQGVEL